MSPLPTDPGSWPPRDTKPYVDQAVAAAAWWSGDIETLKDTATSTAEGARRKFWGRRKTGDRTNATAHLHAPLAGDIAAVSAELLFGDPIELTVDNTAAQEQIEALEVALGLPNRFLEAAETCAATGGVYLRCAWDQTVADHALLQTYPQTHAVPDFRYGHLTAVSLWEDVYVDAGSVWRHIERHEKGRILHGLYQGTRTMLGNPVNLGAHPTTADLDPEIVLPGRLGDRLLVSYVPNVLPNRKLPMKPIGRADWVGSEPFLDALDEAWTCLMRDIRLGQAHVVVPEEWLTKQGTRPGQPATLDMDTEVFTALNMADSKDQKMELHQPDIRVDLLLSACVGLTERIVSAAGYSPQTFGLQIDGSAQSGTALRIREGKTDKTVAKKQRYWVPGVAGTTRNLLDIGAEIFGTPTLEVGEQVAATFPELANDPAEQALWINTLRQAQALSIEGAVRKGQPDLDDTQVDEEVARITAENTVSVADPFPMV